MHTSRRTDLDPRVLALLKWLQSREELNQPFEGGEDEVAAKSSLKKKESQDIPLKRTFDRILDIGTNSGKVAIEMGKIHLRLRRTNTVGKHQSHSNRKPS